jgi:hypothetical protein
MILSGLLILMDDESRVSIILNDSGSVIKIPGDRFTTRAEILKYDGIGIAHVVKSGHR